ncbi:glycosyltransferase family 2 protein [Rhizobium sp. 18055]|jgi:GT2 family glycosyltransferase|uniref:glycosyltransferase family 2 protein n=1 Tax=Rhizobium sp. 18055 TaxID=2681403 RepID=UPI00135B0A15|nr:glycosyltransferase [Rhizobium sp. 18055]
MKIVVAFATSNRRDILTKTILAMSRQTRLPDQIFVSSAKPEDVDEDAVAAGIVPVTVMFGPAGLAAQRNTALAAAGDADLVIFFDDDFIAANDFVARTETLFERLPRVVVATGSVVADGILGPGYNFSEGEELLARTPTALTHEVSEVHNAYGCNMVVRMAPVREHELRFDENLPLYGWWEDVDFSRQLARFGQVVRSSAMKGVHLGFKRSGRTPGRPLGYSQVANRIYLVRKGTVSKSHAWKGIIRNLLANLFHIAKPEPWVDRRGRLAGNTLALVDLIKGDLAPERMLQL